MLLAQLALFFLVLEVIIRPIMAAYLFTRPPRLRVAFSSPEDWGVEYEDVQFSGGGGVMLEGWYVPSQNGAAVLLLHGHSGNRLAVAYHAETLARAGYGVLLFDLRAHGNSGGRHFSGGQETVEDVLAAVALLMRRHDVRRRVGIMGVSSGGTLAIQAAARNTAVRAVVVDGPTLGTIDDLPPPEGVVDRFWRYPLERYYQAAIDWFSRSPRLWANTTALGRVARRPVFFISTGRGMERRLTRHYYDVAAEPKQWWEIPQARHATGWIAEPEAYAREMVGFFDRALPANHESALAEQPERTALDEHDISQERTPSNAPDAPRLIGERTVPPSTAMMIAFATIPLAMILLILPFQLRWGLLTPRLPSGQELVSLLGLLVLLMAGLLLHEAVHLAGYRLIGRVPRDAAHFNFGRAALSPQVRCDVPVRADAFRRIVLLPALVLGVLPGLLAFIIGSWVILIWSVWMLVAASGDFVTLWAMRDVGAGAPVRAHPTRVGCQIFAATETIQNIDK